MKSRFFLFVSLAVDLLIAIFKFVAAAFTGSSSMVSEGIHSVIDTISQLLLIWGVKSSSRKADLNRPFGYGRDLYFWSFIVSLVIFLLGGCISVYEGIQSIGHPESEGNVAWNFSILGIAFVFNTISLISAYNAFNKQRTHKSFFKSVIQSKDPSTFIVLLGDVGDLTGLIIAFVGILASMLSKNPVYDGIASVLIGIVMLAISGLLVRESKSLLLGETTSLKTLKKVISLAEADAAVMSVKKHFSTYMGPEEVLLQLNTVFKDDLTTKQITDSIERIIKAIQTDFPRIKQIFIEPVAK